MYKRPFLIPIVIFVLIGFLTSSAFATPPTWNGGLYVWPFWQYEPAGGGIEAPWATDPNNHYAGVPGKTIAANGCLITSMAMLLRYHGLNFIPDKNHVPNSEQKLDPGSLNIWLTENNGYEYRVDKKHYKEANLDLLTIPKKLYYADSPWYNWNKNVSPEMSCAPYPYGKEKNGKTITYTEHYDCFDVQWSDSKAETFLVNDLLEGQPDVIMIKHAPSSNLAANLKDWLPHFVLVSGYDTFSAPHPYYSASYRANDPAKVYEVIPPPGLNWFYPPYNALTGKFDINGVETHSIERILRYSAKYNRTPPDLSGMSIRVHSPVEIQITNPEGFLTGYDPDGGAQLGENPNAHYFEDFEPSLDSIPDETTKTLTIYEPAAGNYILKIFGIGDGPYTIDFRGTISDGTANLETSITGTAFPGFYDTYRIKYSPTGEASLSHDNQPPASNAGPAQTVNQGDVVKLDASASNDPDGDPITYKWTFQARPVNSMTVLSDTSAINPSFTADKAGTYVLQLVVNDYFIDSTLATVTITANPIKSQISVTPNFNNPLTTGSGVISFDVSNTGRLGVSSGIINVNLADPNGVVISTASQSFAMNIGESKIVSVPVTIPPLKFGAYTLTYTQSDETRTGAPTTTTIQNAVIATFTFDKTSYRIGETANIALNVTDTGQFSQDNLTVMVYAPDAGFSDTRSVSLGMTPATLNYTMSIPATITAGQHILAVKFTTTAGSTNQQTAKFAIPASALAVNYIGSTSLNAGDFVSLSIENTGGVDTTYTAEKLTLTDSKGVLIAQANLTGSIASGENKAISAVQIPAQAATGTIYLYTSLKDGKTGKTATCYQALNVTGVHASLISRTNKDVYLAAEPITTISTLATGDSDLADALLDIKIVKPKEQINEVFTHFLPLTQNGWAELHSPSDVASNTDGAVYVLDSGNVLKFDADRTMETKWGGYCPPAQDEVTCNGGVFLNPNALAVSPDGFVYVVDGNRIQKFDNQGNFIAKWGANGDGDAQFNYPFGIAVAPNGTIYVADTYNYRIQKFDADGVFLGKWGVFGTENGQFQSPYGIAVGPDGSVYVADADNARIQKFTGNGVFISTWGNYGTGNGQFQYPWDVTVDSTGNVFVSDIDRTMVQKFDSSGAFIAKWGSSGSGDGQWSYPLGLSVTGDGFIWVADPSNSRIQKFTQAGTFVTKIYGGSGSAEGVFNEPKSVAASPDGSVYVVDTRNMRVQRFDGNGNFISMWGGTGSAGGLFHDVDEIAVGPDGSVYSYEPYNNRVWKFDSNGNFLMELPSKQNIDYFESIATDSAGFVYGLNAYFGYTAKFAPNGLFIKNIPIGNYGDAIAVGNDGSIYIAGGYSIRKYDSNGIGIKSWGSPGNGNGQFAYTAGITVTNDNFVYATDAGNNRIQKFDTNGNYIAQWGGFGYDDGQFYTPGRLSVGPDGTVYVADVKNHRIQSMHISHASETLFSANVPIAQAGNAVQDYIKEAGTINTTGKLFLRTTLRNKLGETLATSEYPFYIVQGNTVLSFSTDKKVYKPGETVIVTGLVENHDVADLAGLNLSFAAQLGTQNPGQIYVETFDVPSLGRHPFTFNQTAGSEGIFTLFGDVTMNNTSLVKIIDQYEVAKPAVTTAISGPDVVNRNPFELTVELKNTGKVDASLQYVASSSQGESIDSKPLIIAAGETLAVHFTRAIVKSTTYSVVLSGDVAQSASKTVTFGEAAYIRIGTQGAATAVFPEGKAILPVTIYNFGQVDVTLVVTYQLSQGSGQQNTEIRTYFLPKSGSITDTLTYTFAQGIYNISAVSMLPAASAAASIKVLKLNDVAMITVVGDPGADRFIPVSTILVNNGYNEINGIVRLSVLNNQQVNVWTGDVLVSGLKPQASGTNSGGEGQASGLVSGSTGTYTINVNSANMVSGGYIGNNVMFSTSGQQLASNQAQIRVPGPSFEITSFPANPVFTAGRTATLTFGVKNTGTLAGQMSIAVKAMDILNQTLTDTLDIGAEKTYSFTFQVPENAVAADYFADYTLSGSDVQKGNAKFTVAGVNVGVTAALDKQVYLDGDAAALKLTIEKQSQFEDGTYLAIIRYGTYHDMRTVTIGALPASITFTVPLGTITKDRLFYGIYFESGRKIHQNSLPINTPPTVAVVSPTANSIYNSAVNISVLASDGGLGIGAVEYQVDSGLWLPLLVSDPAQGLYSAIWTPTFENNGQRKINFRATDINGNSSFPVSVTVIVQIDTTPPTGSITINNGTAFTNEILVGLSLSCTDTESGCAQMLFSNDNTTWSIPEAFATTKAWQLLQGEGSKNVFVKFIDNVGNSSGVYTAGITLDTSPPITAALPAGGLSNKTLIVTLTVNEPATLFYTINGTTPTDTSAQYSGPLSISETTTLKFFAKDKAGNNTLVMSETYTIDTQPPVLSLSTLPDGSSTNKATLNIAGTATDNIGIREVTINNSTVPVNADGTFSQAIVLATGANTVTTSATDQAGNTTIDVRSVILDEKAPQLLITNPSDNSVTNAATVMVTGTVDETATVLVKLNTGNQGPANMTGNTFNLPINLEYDRNTIEVAATDPAMNTSTDKRTVIYDNINPSLAVTYPAQDITTDKTGIVLHGTVSDLTAVTVAITFEGLTYKPIVTSGMFQQELTFTKEKTYPVIVTATDAAGNATTVQRNIVYAIARHNATTLTYTGATFIAQGSVVTLSAALKVEDAVAPNPTGQVITFTFGTGSANQSCRGTTDVDGNASCTITQVTIPTGPTTITAIFTGDSLYLPSSDNKGVIVFAYPASGMFVIGDKNAAINTPVTFWGAQWTKNNALSKSSAPASFKGFAESLSTTPPSCNETWSAGTGNSSNPPSSIPTYMAILVSSGVTKSGSTISGDIMKMVIVQTSAGYGSDPGHAGAGIVVGVICTR